MDVYQMKEEWRSVLVRCQDHVVGAQFVMITGIIMMLKLFVDNLVIGGQMVSSYTLLPEFIIFDQQLRCNGFQGSTVWSRTWKYFIG